MTDEKEIKEEEVETEVDDKALNEKKFSQKDVDRIVQREKAKSKAWKEELDNLKAGKDENLTNYEKVIQKLVDEMSAEVPESIKKLMAKLTPLEQLEYLSDPENNIVYEKKQFPVSKEKAKSGKKEFTPSKIDRFL
jgi:hypothetical protein